MADHPGAERRPPPSSPGATTSRTTPPSPARLNWLRAGVLGANDGIVSTAGLVIGVAAATTSRARRAHRRPGGARRRAR